MLNTRKVDRQLFDAPDAVRRVYSELTEAGANGLSRQELSTKTGLGIGSIKEAITMLTQKQLICRAELTRDEHRVFRAKAVKEVA